jgi:ribosomal protein L19
MDVREFVKPKVNPNIPQISPGDTVKVSLKTMEGDKERLQNFQGVVIRTRKGVAGGSFTVRRVSYGINPLLCKMWQCSGMDRFTELNSTICAGSALNRRGLRKDGRGCWSKPCLKRKNLHKQNSPLNELRRGGSQFTGEPVHLFLRYTARAQH